MPKDDALFIADTFSDKIVARPLSSDTMPKTWKSSVYLSWLDTNALSDQARDFLNFLMRELDLKEVDH